jgi:hypothetical protein
MLQSAQILRFAGPLLLAAAPAAAQPSLTLPRGSVQATVTVENDASTGHFGDVASIAPDLSFGVARDLTLSLVHSTFGRTGFRGTAGSGFCATDDCSSAYDNAGLEATYALRDGRFAAAANAGVHVTSFDRELVVGKLGAKLRYQVAKATFAFLPSVTLALGHRDDPMPNRDRVWLPLSGMYNVAGGLSLGAATGFKAPLDDVRHGYEIATGLLAQYGITRSTSLGASWVHGKLVGGSAALPDDMQGVDSRAVQLWVTATY